MPRDNIELAQETKRWKDYISNINNIPLDENYAYKNENDIYERLTHHVQHWIEGELGYYRNQNGQLANLDSEERTKECEDLDAVAGWVMTSLEDNWYSVALNGNKKEKATLPHFSYEQVHQEKREDVRKQVQSTFFPAYRALKESFDKRPFWQWFTNHAQYTAERDTLKVMKNLLKSAMQMDDKSLKAAMKEYQKNVTAEEIQAAEVPPIKMAKDVEELVQDDAINQVDSLNEVRETSNHEMYKTNSNQKETNKESLEEAFGEDQMRGLIEDLLWEEKPETMKYLKEFEPAAYKKMVDEKYEKAIIHDRLVDEYPDADENTLNKMVEEEFAKRGAEQNEHEQVDLTQEFQEDKNVPTSEKIQESPELNKDLKI